MRLVALALTANTPIDAWVKHAVTGVVGAATRLGSTPSISAWLTPHASRSCRMSSMLATWFTRAGCSNSGAIWASSGAGARAAGAAIICCASTRGSEAAAGRPAATTPSCKAMCNATSEQGRTTLQQGGAPMRINVGGGAAG
jgi:hypothetical protein